MNIAIITSIKDPAGLNIKRALIEKHNFVKLKEPFGSEYVYSKDTEINKIRLYTAQAESINNESIDEEISKTGATVFIPDLIIFATKHESKSGINSLSCHSPGNWGKAEFGGEDKKLCIAPANYLKRAFILLNTTAKEFAGREKFDIVMECTHHGPHVKTPIMFIEIGSCETAWNNKEAGNIIADTIIKLLTEPVPEYKSCIGLGGLHTCSSFNKIQLGNEYALGHVCPKYALEDLNKEMLIAALDNTLPKAETVMLDWKGLGQHKERIKAILDELSAERKIEVIRTHGI